MRVLAGDSKEGDVKDSKIQRTYMRDYAFS